MKRILLLALAVVIVLAISACGNDAGVDTGGGEAPVSDGGAVSEESGDDGQAPVAAPEDKHFGDVSIVFFPGGSEGDSFASVVYNGAVAAANDMGCKVDYMWSGWQPDKMVSQFKDAIAMKPTGICIMGHPGDDAFAPLVDEARAAGIIVTCQNSSLPTIEDKYKAEGFGYVGQELYASGEMLGKAALNRSGAQAGDTAIVWGLLGQEGRGQRTKGVVDAFEAAGLDVAYYEISDAVNADAAQGTSVFAGFIAANPDAKIVVTDHGALTSTIGTYLSAAGKQPGEIYAAGFDLSAASVEAINSGYLGCILDQQPWLQGYLPIVQVCLTAQYGFSGLHIDTGASIIDQSNIELVAPLAEQGIR
ncbi:MAG: substrate-binding domain-containing protein [Clostridiales bacterium]|nr:substrate-binding domain-containing protein [Clostridiales bacterium]